MNYFQRIFVVFLTVSLLGGCAAAFVPYTSDPARKLGWAAELMENHDRPLPAESLINEAIEIYTSQQNELGLAEAYRVYGLFFKSYAVTKRKIYFQEYGFLDKSATYDKRYEKALEYFDKSKDIFQKNNVLDRLSNVYIQIGITYARMNNSIAACNAYNEGLKIHQNLMKQNPEFKYVLPKQYSDFSAGVSDLKNKTGCLW